MKAMVVYGYSPQDTDGLTPIGRLNTEAGAELFSREGGRIIPAGGRTGKSDLSEAEVIQRWLILKGAPKECIIPETKAANTIENVVFVANIADRLGVNRFTPVSLQYHLPQSQRDLFSDRA